MPSPLFGVPRPALHCRTRQRSLAVAPLQSGVALFHLPPSTALVASLTGCPADSDVGQSIGKDFFFGLWKTTDYEEDGTLKNYYIGNYNGTGNAAYNVTWFFDGTSENLFKADGGTFKQFLVNYKVGSDGKPTDEVQNMTYWTGAYQLKGDSSYSKGKLFLYYEFGVDIDDYYKAQEGNSGKTPTVADVQDILKEIAGAKFLDYGASKDEQNAYPGWTSADFLNKAFGNEDGDKNLYSQTLTEISATTNEGYEKNNIKIQVRKADENANAVCCDVEYFRFNLKDQTNSGYARMLATTHATNWSDVIGKTFSQWYENTDDTKWTGKYGYDITEKVAKTTGCSWGSAYERCMARYKLADGTTPVSSDKTSNTELFKIGTEDTSDTTDYENVEKGIEQ